MSDRQRVTSGSSYEPWIGFCRALRVGERVLVSGTGPIWPDGSCDEDAGAQARRCLDIILTALAEVGAGPGDVVRTRMYITDRNDVGVVGRVHGAAFGEVRPVTTIVVVTGFADPRWKVEIEAEAVLS